MTISGEVTKRPIRRTRNYLQLLAIAHDQLLAEFGEKYSTADLLHAAQILVEVTDANYEPRDPDRGRIVPNYFTFATDEMMTRSSWLIFCNERACHDFDLDGAEIAAMVARERYLLNR